ncbi:MAG: hypothetical protein ABJ333_00570 [Algoriphagus sp.]
MKYLILVACSYLILLSCSSPSNVDEHLVFPIDVSEIYDDVIKGSQHPFWGGPIKVTESGDFLSFQVSGSKDVIVIDVKSRRVEKMYPNPPDSIGGMVYRYDPVSFVFIKKSEFFYLKNENQLIQIGDLLSEEKPYLIEGEKLSNPGKIIHLSDEELLSYWRGSSSKQSPSSGGVFFTDLNKNSTKCIIPDTIIGSVADLVAVNEKIYILEKYKPVIRVFDFTGKDLYTIELPKSEYLKYQKLERPTGFLKLTAEEKVASLEDYCLDITQQGDTTAFLHHTYSVEDKSLKENYVLSLFADGKLQEKILDFKPMNFSVDGGVYFFNETDSGQYLLKKPLNHFF